MKRILLLFAMLITLSNNSVAQCFTTSNFPTSNCTFGDAIDAFTLNSVSTTGNSFCNSNTATGYSFYTTPVRTLTAGSTYSWSAITGTLGPYYTYTQGFAIWIDLNNNGQYESSELMAASSGIALSHSGTITIPANATIANNIKMRTRCRYNQTLGAGDACASYNIWRNGRL